MSDLEALLGAALIAAVPLVLAALGEAVAERAGLLNLGIEGMVVAGAFFGFLIANEAGGVGAGVLAGIGAGLLLGLLFAALAVGLRVDQVLGGLAITIFGLGLTAFLFRDVYGRENPIASVTPREIAVPWLRDLPLVGGPLFAQPVLFYVAWALVPVVGWGLERTRFGLEIRAVGEQPFAADAAGVSVARTRWLAAAVGGGMAGFGGAYLAVVDLKLFQTGMTGGLGFIGLALAIVGRWTPWRIAAGALAFGLLRALATTLQIRGWDELWGIELRAEVLGMLPYLGIMLALALLAGRARPPAALGVPYERGRR